MAQPSPSFALALLLLFSSLIASHGWSGPSSADLEVLKIVNGYRTNVAGIPVLATNDAAGCVGYQVALKLVNTPCNNQTGADTAYGQSPQFSDYPNMLATCGVSVENATGGYIAPNCVPSAAATSDAPSIAAQNITEAPLYAQQLNDTTFTSAGVGSDGVWYVLVLATSSLDGNFGVTPGLRSAASVQRIPTVLLLALVLFVSLFGLRKW